MRSAKVLAQPPPRYLPEQDDVVGFLQPIYTPLDFRLPMVERAVAEDDVLRCASCLFRQPPTLDAYSGRNVRTDSRFCSRLTPYYLVS